LTTPASTANDIARLGLWAGPLLFAVALVVPAPVEMSPSAWRLVATTLWMGIWWLSEAVPIAATSLIPLAAYPLLGIQSAGNVSTGYLDQNVFLYFGGFVIALGIERCGLHRRIALQIVGLVGSSPRRIVLGVMLATGFLSMWISNTAATMLMLPITLALLATLRNVQVSESTTTGEAHTSAGQVPLQEALLLGIAYSASLGGLATTVGTPTNLSMIAIWEKRADLVARYGSFSMGSWIAAFLPVAVVMILIAWWLMTRHIPQPADASRLGRSFIRERIGELGRMSRAERIMTAVFVATALLWMTRVPLEFGGFTVIPGWGPAIDEFVLQRLTVPKDFGAQPAVHDSTIAMLMAVLLFVLPGDRDPNGKSRMLMDWETVQQKLPWGVLLLFGGGLVMAAAFDETGLSQWIGDHFIGSARNLPPLVLIGLVCLMMTFLTEFTSNVATITTMAPILLAAAVPLEVDPRLLLLPATISASCGFMMPVGTPPNAIVYSTGLIRTRDMLRFGFWLNLISVFIVTAATFLLVRPLLGIPL
jgi:sodium-dependent dicarboxylate transporter 2/3/5